jgi:methyl-accepting chemotaxis protein
MTTYTESTSTAAPAAVVEQDKPRKIWLLGRRRRFLVPGAYQWRTLALLGGLTLLLVAALDAALIALVETGSAHVLQVAPELQAFVAGQDRDVERLIVVGSIATLLGVLLIGLLETHRTAGPIHSLSRAMERYPVDGLRTRVRLRKDDHFQNLERAFNKMASDLEARSLARVAELARITSRLQQSADSLTQPGGYDAETQATLRSLAFDLHKLGEDIERR